MFINLLELYKEESIKQKHSYNYLKLFAHIKENQIYYKTMLKLIFFVEFLLVSYNTFCYHRQLSSNHH